MSKITNEHQAIDKALRLIALEEYETLDEVNNISRVLSAQCAILALYRMNYTRFDIADAVGVKEKAVRMWLNADHIPTLEHLVELAKFYERARKAHAKSTR